MAGTKGTRCGFIYSQAPCKVSLKQAGENVAQPVSLTGSHGAWTVISIILLFQFKPDEVKYL